MKTKTSFDHTYVVEANSPEEAEKTLREKLEESDLGFLDQAELKSQFIGEEILPGSKKIKSLEEVLDETEDYLKNRVRDEYSAHVW